MKNISMFLALVSVSLFFMSGVNAEPSDTGQIDATDSGVFYSVQVSSFKTESAAKDERDMLAEYGKESFILKSESKKADDVWYKVYAGKYNDKEEAGKKRLLFVKDGFKDCVVRKIHQNLYQELLVP